MNFWTRFFKHKPSLPKAMAFVDYEHWFYSYKNTFGLKPDVATWRAEIAEHYELVDVIIFGNFGPRGMSEQLTSLRTITNSIIETRQAFDRIKKDMTDFIMLDYIYQAPTLHPEVDVYILFTGDGHFQSAVKYLTQRLRKTVVVYGVRGSMSSGLEAVASECHVIPAMEKPFEEYQRMIVANMAYVSTRNEIIPSFNGTVEAVARRNGVPVEMVAATLRSMLDDGLLYQKDFRVDFNRKVKVIAANWEALHKAGLWSYEE